MIKARADALSFGDRFPDEFGNVEHQVWALLVRVVRSADLAHTHAHNIIEPSVPLAVADVQNGAHDLSSSEWLGAAVAMRLEHNCRAIVGLGNGAKCPERAGLLPFGAQGSSPRKRPATLPSQ